MPIDKPHQEFTRLDMSQGWEVPPGYPPDHPMADLLRAKDVVFGRRLSDEEVMSPALPDTLANAYQAAMPVFRFLSTLRA